MHNPRVDTIADHNSEDGQTRLAASGFAAGYLMLMFFPYR